ncbi:hypothetical protein SCL_2636 [Sulfuricaulis limicola]|uniref:Pyridoxamine 5'-phosphate oxidase putative domain-containing protein n=1 Tax=Sulfuricaulis limicola TaxID=1620215 RepID=A0A1B4XJC5_9GAMM|nr:hypothetical protein [Sulfuricaulis limicola]BAV34913.1 hypothetical protein SCL_2636 [Sulfuricaulis limicola]
MDATASGNQPDAPLLDEARADFITHHVAMNVASCSAARVPSVVRAHGCRVSADRRRVTVFVSVPRAARVIEDLRAGGGIAVVFTLPHTHETLQLKGARADVVPLAPGDDACIRAYVESFVKELVRVHHREALGRAVMSSADEESMGLVFEPNAAFVQTPGPKAGSRLERQP